MKFDPSLANFTLALVVAASGWFFRWNDKRKFEKQEASFERQQAITKAEAAAEKKVNEERDFNHLLNNQRQISQGITTGFDEIEERIEHLRELMLKIEAYLIRNQGTNHHE
ncbi:MAG: hypothetical protein V7K18_25085 [Nostoc sp.]|uniref:hypothetical protein n=1 Tax=Nostoc sp. TaxID=1180 RepID=UPI002FFB7E40